MTANEAAKQLGYGDLYGDQFEPSGNEVSVDSCA